MLCQSKSHRHSWQFWRSIKPLLSDKSKSNEKITTVEDNKVISEDKDNVELLNPFFFLAVKNLKTPEFSDSNSLAENIPQPIFKAILKYKNHSGIIAIKKARNGPVFSFCEVSVNGVFKKIKRLKGRKAEQTTDIPAKTLKENADFLNETIRSVKLPAVLKNGNITAAFKQAFNVSRENYWPVSILPIVSKIFEEIFSK